MPPALLAAGILTAFGLCGCATTSRSSGASGLIADKDWPARITTGLNRLAANVPTVLRSREDADPVADIRVVRSEECGLGLVLELEHQTPEASGHSTRETQYVFLSFSPLEHAAERQERLPDTIVGKDLEAGVHWHLYEPENEAAQGLIVHLGGNKYVREALLERGWAVLDAASTGRNVRRRANPVSFEIERGERLDEVATQIAAIFDDELADWPYSLEAVLQYLARHRPDVPQAPTAVMGFSIGAIALPAVAARMPDRFDAAVLVAGGANLLEVSCRTTKTDSGLKLEWLDAQPREEDWQALYAAYLAHTRLDPYHTAAALNGIPLLVFHGGFDRVVPASTGELLFSRLGKAERHVFPVGHQHLLRVVMRMQAKQIVRWAEAAIEAAPEAGDEPRR